MASSADLTLTTLNIDELAARIGQPVSGSLLAVLPEAVRRARLGPYLNDKQAQEETGLSARQLRYLREKRRLEYRVIGRTVLYPTDKLFEYIDSGTVPTRHDPNA